MLEGSRNYTLDFGQLRGFQTVRPSWNSRNVSLALKLLFPITATPRYQLHNKGRNPTSAIVPINPCVKRKGKNNSLTSGSSALPLPCKSRLKALPDFVSGMYIQAVPTKHHEIMVIHCACRKFLCHFHLNLQNSHLEKNQNTRELVYWSVVLPILQLEWVQTYGQLSSLSRTKSSIGLNLCCTITKTTSIKISKNAEILFLSLLLPCYYHSHETGEWRYCRGNSSWFHPFLLPWLEE